MFDKLHLKQPVDSYSRGAGTLAAILNAPQQHLFDESAAVNAIYNTVREQQRLPPANGYSYFQGDKCLSLSSGLVNVALEKKLFKKVTVWFRSELPAGFERLTEDEKTRLQKNADVIESKGALETLVKQPGFYPVLVDDGLHWVAVSQHIQPVCYDPASGSEQAEVNADRLSLPEQHYDSSGVLIHFA